jgi:hypothetical protein
VVIAATIGLVIGLPDRSTQSEPLPEVLEAPSPPTESAVVGEPLPGEDWVAMALPHDGYVASVTAGQSEWLVVSSGDGVEVHTSSDAMTWTSSRLATRSAMVMAPDAVADDRLVIAGTDVADSAGWSWVSDDSGSTWTHIGVDDRPMSLSSVFSVSDRVFAAGAVLSPPGGNRGADGGRATVWRLDGTRWEEVPFARSPGDHSWVAAIVGIDESTFAVGSDARGLAVWELVGSQWDPVPVSGGEGARPTSVTRSSDGQWITSGYTSDSRLVSSDLRTWHSLDAPTHWRTASMDDETIGAGFDYLAVESDGQETARQAVSMGLISDLAANDDGVIVAAGARSTDHTGVLWIHGVPGQPTIEPASD